MGRSSFLAFCFGSISRSQFWTCHCGLHRILVCTWTQWSDVNSRRKTYCWCRQFVSQPGWWQFAYQRLASSGQSMELMECSYQARFDTKYQTLPDDLCPWLLQFNSLEVTWIGSGYGSHFSLEWFLVLHWFSSACFYSWSQRASYTTPLVKIVANMAITT